MYKCISLIVTLAVWCQITTGRAIEGGRLGSHEHWHHGFKHHDPSGWHEAYNKDRDLEPSDNGNSKPYWRQHHSADWDTDHWPGYHGKQWGHGPNAWSNQNWHQNKPNAWNNGWNNQGHNWNNQGGSWDNQAAPTDWNNQGVPNNWNQGGGNWNNPNSPNSWNNQNTPDNGWNQQPNTWDNQGANNWNNQNPSNTWEWEDQGGTNQNQNNNNQRPTRVPQATTASPNQVQVTQCIRTCPVTPEYNPVCGSDNVTYGNVGRLECAKFCGVEVTLSRNSPCTVAGVSTNSPIAVEPTNRPDPVGPGSNPDITIAPDILNSIFTTTEENVDIDIRTRNRSGVPTLTK